MYILQVPYVFALTDTIRLEFNCSFANDAMNIDAVQVGGLENVDNGGLQTFSKEYPNTLALFFILPNLLFSFC